MKEKKKQLFIEFIMLFILSFLCITINSKNSFLYSFQDSSDIHSFFTVARGMAHGSVVYKDIFEIKGLYVFVLYFLSFWISHNSFIGIYIIEVFLFSLFLFFGYKTITLISNNKILNIITIVLVAIESTVRSDFYAGGEVEELCLAPVMISIYLVLIIIRKWDENEKRKEALYSAIIGACFGVVFWSKYTLTGMYLGAVIGIITIGIIKRDFMHVVKLALWFLVGMVVTTTPVLLYFHVNDALPDLWDAYFYTMLFKYSRIQGENLHLLKNIKHIVRWWLFIPLVSVILVPKRVIAIEIKILTLFMLAFEVLGVACGNIWGYSREILFAFTVFWIVPFAFLLDEFRKKEALYPRIHNQLEQWKNEWNEKYRRILVKKKTRFFLYICIIAYICVLIVIPSYTRCFMNWSEDDYVQYRIRDYILARSTKETIILHFDMIDSGVYYLTGIEPPCRVFHTFNMFSAKELGYYDKYIYNRKADFVVSTRQQTKLEDLGYKKVIDEEQMYIHELGERHFVLYAREDLADENKDE